MKKKYFPHDIEAVMNSEFPDDVPVEEFIEERTAFWIIPSSVCALMRVSNKRTGKVTEYSYQRPHAARARLEELLQDKDNEVLLADDNSILDCLS